MYYNQAAMSTQVVVRLPDDLAGRLAREARRKGRGRSDVIREALREYLGGAGVTGGVRPYDLVRDLIGSVSSGIPDLGQKHREHLKSLFRDRRD